MNRCLDGFHMPYANPKSPEAIASQKRRCHRYYVKHYKDRIGIHRAKKLREDPEYRLRRQDERRSWGQRRRERLVEILGGPKCIRCGFSDIRALCLDHVNGDGRKDVIRFGNNAKMYNYYLQNPNEAREHLQVLCENCNRIKQRENKEWQGRFL